MSINLYKFTTAHNNLRNSTDSFAVEFHHGNDVTRIVVDQGNAEEAKPQFIRPDNCGQFLAISAYRPSGEATHMFFGVYFAPEHPAPEVLTKFDVRELDGEVRMVLELLKLQNPCIACIAEHPAPLLGYSTDECGEELSEGFLPDLRKNSEKYLIVE